MPLRVISLHDRRLSGNLPRNLPGSEIHRVYEVDENTRLVGMLRYLGDEINGLCNIGGQEAPAPPMLDLLRIYCHGYEGCVERRSVPDLFSPRLMAPHRGFVCTRESLGFGLTLCHEGVFLCNVANFHYLRNKTRQIILYACGPARTDQTQLFGRGDGRSLCQTLANITDAFVYASEHTQYYHRVGDREQIHFGPWEGNLYRFTPGASTPARVGTFPTGP